MPAIPEPLGITFGGADGFPIETEKTNFIKHFTVVEGPSECRKSSDFKDMFNNDFSENMLLHSYNWPKDSPKQAYSVRTKRNKQEQIVIKFETDNERTE